VRLDDEPRLMRHKYQGIPERGYAGLMSSMLAGIPVVLNCDYLLRRNDFFWRRALIFTGPIDEYFGFDLGRLRYRGQAREHRYDPDAEYVQPCGQVNNPDLLKGPHIRTLEWKHMMPHTYASKIRGTVLTTETTYTPDHPDQYEYPFPDKGNSELYEKYRIRADAIPGLIICGRLGEYRYYDMDQAIARARLLANRLLNSV
jgi:UDP-galactopyranose mutase